MVQKDFAAKASTILQEDNFIIGIAAGGSYITGELDEFSDLDLVIVTKESIAGNKHQMVELAERLGNLLSSFTGEHVGEPRLLICLYDNPLLHVDLKFVTPEEFKLRVEDPVILLDRAGLLQKIINESKATFPYPDYQWIEDRFWIWVHYGLLKIGRGEYIEALDFLSYLRMVVLGPLLHIKNGNLPRGVRKVEMLPAGDYNNLASTIGSVDKVELISSLENAISLYQELREVLFKDQIWHQTKTEHAVLSYLKNLKSNI